MPKFLNRAEVYRMIQRELPDGAYPDGAEDDFYSTADSAATAHVIAKVYENQERIYANYFPQDADERIIDWQRKAFGKLLPAGLTLQEQRDRIISKLRSRKGLTIRDKKEIVWAVIGTDKMVDVMKYGDYRGTWVLDESELDIDTFLGGFDPLHATGPDLCSKGPADFGLTQDQWDAMRADAYGYEVRIYGYTLTPAEYAEIDEQLSIYETARSYHRITDSLDPADRLPDDGSGDPDTEYFTFDTGRLDITPLA